tara:strand:+ start:6827 stop:7606 length:780 start_codon:yes stop_codon:yes gene_type:complete
MEIYRSDEKKTNVSIKDGIIYKKFASDNCELFLKEKKFLEQLKNFVGFPDYLGCTGSTLVLKYYEKGTLLDYPGCINKDKTHEAVVKNLLEMNSIENNSLKDTAFFCYLKLYLSRFRDLFLSGPKKTKVKRTRYFLNKLIMYFTFAFFSILILFSYLLLRNSNITGNVYHGDLHLNNIVLDDNCYPIIIDFENAKSIPGLLIDYCYFSQIYSARYKKNYGSVHSFESAYCSSLTLRDKISLMLHQAGFKFAIWFNPRFK